ncbi:hypothetical protein Bbelb_420480 [Branchiostoma belcheri]|nr:hypothetical protein Bbelb_420480 [Branchiostoma belcheri]
MAISDLVYPFSASPSAVPGSPCGYYLLAARGQRSLRPAGTILLPGDKFYGLRSSAGRKTDLVYSFNLDDLCTQRSLRPAGTTCCPLPEHKFYGLRSRAEDRPHDLCTQRSLRPAGTILLPGDKFYGLRSSAGRKTDLVYSFNLDDLCTQRSLRPAGTTCCPSTSFTGYVAGRKTDPVPQFYGLRSSAGRKTDPVYSFNLDDLCTQRSLRPAGTTCCPLPEHKFYGLRSRAEDRPRVFLQLRRSLHAALPPPGGPQFYGLRSSAGRKTDPVYSFNLDDLCTQRSLRPAGTTCCPLPEHKFYGLRSRAEDRPRVFLQLRRSLHAALPPPGGPQFYGLRSSAGRKTDPVYSFNLDDLCTQRSLRPAGTTCCPLPEHKFYGLRSRAEDRPRVFLQLRRSLHAALPPPGGYYFAARGQVLRAT